MSALFSGLAPKADRCPIVPVRETSSLATGRNGTAPAFDGDLWWWTLRDKQSWHAKFIVNPLSI